MLPIAILAGGLATRLRPVTETIPKALIEISGEPFLAHQLRLLRRNGFERIVLCVGHRAGQIRDFAGDGSRFGLNIEYSLDADPLDADSLNANPRDANPLYGPRLLGTAGAIRRALPLLGDSFAAIYGDSYLPCDYAAALTAFRDSGKLGLMSVYRNSGKWDASNVEFTGGRILAYDKANQSPAMHHIDYGLGAFRRAAFEGVPAERPHDLAAVYRDLLQRGQLAAWESPGRFYEIGSLEGIRDLTELLAS